MINNDSISTLVNILQMELDNLSRSRRPRNVWEVVRGRWWPYRGLRVSLFSLLRRWYLSRSTLGDDYRDMLMGVIERLSFVDGADLRAQYKIVPKHENGVTAKKKPKSAPRGKRKK